MNARSIRRRTGSSLSARLMLALVAVALLMSLVPLTGGLPEGWNGRLSQLQSGCEKVAAAADLEGQRSAFLELSNAMIESAKAMGPLDKAMYVQHCPMAFDNSGGDWLSDSQEVFNPYFGDKMLHCGTVKEALARK